MVNVNCLNLESLGKWTCGCASKELVQMQCKQLLQVPVPLASHHNEQYLEYCNNEPFSLMLLLLGYFMQATRKETKASINTYF